MKVFMLGWEFPPHISGGLGTACFGMTRGLDQIGVAVTFVLPTSVPVDQTAHVKLRTPDHLPPGAEERIRLATAEGQFEHVELYQVPAMLQPYGTPATQEEAVRKLMAKQRAAARQQAGGPGQAGPGDEAPQGAVLPAGTFVPGAGANYEGQLMAQIQRYARLASELAADDTFDVIHAHDWMTYPGGVAAKAVTGKPLVVHVHSTEFDRSGKNVNQEIYDIERMGMHAADCVVCVSHLTATIVRNRYGVAPAKTQVVYNAVDLPNDAGLGLKPIKHTEKIVLFLGRLTMQKGPEYFLRAAKKVVEKFKDVRFVVAGSGDLIARCIEEAAALGLGGYVTFTGFLRGGDVDRVFQMADLYVMPSVSEPFGIAPLEALSHNVPVIISKQSGVSEVLTHALKVDFWDTDEMANKILAVLRHPPLQKTLRQHGQIEMRKFSWVDSARQLEAIYERLATARN